MIGAPGRLVLFSVFLYILVRVNRLSVVIAWAFFLATRLTTVSLDGGARSLTCMSNNAQVHVYINSSEDFKYKGLETFYLYIPVENL